MPVQQIQEKLLGMMQLTLQQQVPEHIVEQIIDVPVIMQTKALAVQVAQKTAEIRQSPVPGKDVGVGATPGAHGSEHEQGRTLVENCN